VDQKNILISDVPWGRSAARRSSGKVNLSLSGKTNVVLVLKSSEENKESFHE